MTLEQIKALNQKENLKRHRVREINGQSKEWSKVNAVTGDTKYKESVPDRTKQWPKQPGLKDNGASKTESINSTLTDQEKGCGGCLVIIVVIVVISQIHQSQKQANDEEALREWKERQKMREEQEQSAELSNSLLLIKGAGEEWLQDATLHNVTVSKWRSASERDKLATCGQWIMTWATHRRATNQYDSMEDLKRHAEYLAQEVDTTIARWKGSDEISLAAVLAGMKLNLVK